MAFCFQSRVHLTAFLLNKIFSGTGCPGCRIFRNFAVGIINSWITMFLYVTLFLVPVSILNQHGSPGWTWVESFLWSLDTCLRWTVSPRKITKRGLQRSSFFWALIHRLAEINSYTFTCTYLNIHLTLNKTIAFPLGWKVPDVVAHTWNPNCLGAQGRRNGNSRSVWGCGVGSRPTQVSKRQNRT